MVMFCFERPLKIKKRIRVRIVPEVFPLFFSHAAYETATMGTNFLQVVIRRSKNKRIQNNIHIFWLLAELPEPSKLQQIAATAKSQHEHFVSETGIVLSQTNL